METGELQPIHTSKQWVSNNKHRPHKCKPVGASPGGGQRRRMVTDHLLMDVNLLWYHGWILLDKVQHFSMALTHGSDLFDI